MKKTAPVSGRGSETVAPWRTSRAASDLTTLLAFFRCLFRGFLGCFLLRGLLCSLFLSRLRSFLLGFLGSGFLGRFLFRCRLAAAASASAARRRRCGLGFRSWWRRNRYGFRFGCVRTRRAGLLFFLFFLEIFLQRLAVSACVAELFFFITCVERGVVTSLILLISVAAGCGPARGHEEFKRPPETSAGTAGDYSTTFGAACKRCNHVTFAYLLSQCASKEKKKSRMPQCSRFADCKKMDAPEGASCVREPRFTD